MVLRACGRKVRPVRAMFAMLGLGARIPSLSLCFIKSYMGEDDSGRRWAVCSPPLFVKNYFYLFSQACSSGNVCSLSVAWDSSILDVTEDHDSVMLSIKSIACSTFSACWL